MFSELNKYKNNGHFFLRKGQSLKEVSKNVPNLPGVYYIIRLAKGRIDLVYIGKAGTINQDGSFKKQGLGGRLNNMQKNEKRQDFFNKKIDEENIDALDIYWFVTYDENHKDLPGFVEAILMQHFFDIYRQLPQWNNAF